MKIWSAVHGSLARPGCFKLSFGQGDPAPTRDLVNEFFSFFLSRNGPCECVTPITTLKKIILFLHVLLTTIVFYFPTLFFSKNFNFKSRVWARFPRPKKTQSWTAAHSKTENLRKWLLKKWADSWYNMETEKNKLRCGTRWYDDCFSNRGCRIFRLPPVW